MALKKHLHEVQFCVIGGGLAGMGAAISAARHGIKTLLMHERPVPGGNASGEIRMWVCGSKLMLETGLIEELRLENRYRNNTSNYSIWDSITYEMVAMQENLTVLFNCSCQDAAMDGSKIVSVTGYQQTTQEFHEVRAQF
ncbi:MAG: FAD-dependent oxidoreductase, partial [Lentisphaeria bacterium]|nr:FAD-dependent oxidoreductase [Lentisphaeria bacterium]